MAIAIEQETWLNEPQILYQTAEKIRSDSSFYLLQGEIQRLTGDHRWKLIYCQEGSLWITQENDLDDYVLQEEEGFLISQRGRVIIQARKNSRYGISPPLTRNPYKGPWRFFS